MKKQTRKRVYALFSNTFQISFTLLYLISNMVFLLLNCNAITDNHALAEHKESKTPNESYANAAITITLSLKTITPAGYQSASVNS